MSYLPVSHRPHARRLAVSVTLALACATNEGDEGSHDEAASTASSEESLGDADDLRTACEAWCQHELDCGAAEPPPYDDCVGACTGESADATAECVDAMADWYSCRAGLECNAEGCPETTVDELCGDAG